MKDLNTTETELCVVVTSDSGDPQASTTQVSSATVATQESIYKNIMKRLALLESNATLSLLYIEEQLKLLSTAFANLEKRQSSNFNSLISSVNVTLINQLNSLKNHTTISMINIITYSKFSKIVIDKSCLEQTRK